MDYDVLGSSLWMNMQECSKQVGLATDWAAANVAGNELMEKELEWIFWIWCLTHRLELAIKDALYGTAFNLNH